MAALPASIPFLFLWLISPAIAWWLSRPLPGMVTRLTEDETAFLAKLSRETWHFFETFVGPDDNWLPPEIIKSIQSQLLPSYFTHERRIGITFELGCLRFWIYFSGSMCGKDGKNIYQFGKTRTVSWALL